MTSSPGPSPREAEALLHQAATVLRKTFSRLQAEDAVAGRPWGATAKYEILRQAERLDEAAWAIGRGTLPVSTRDAAVEEAKGIVAGTDG